LQALDGFPNTRDHAAGRLPEIITAAGFTEVALEYRMRTAWGSLELLSAAADNLWSRRMTSLPRVLVLRAAPALGAGDTAGRGGAARTYARGQPRGQF
jgi:hypothetical protein